MVGTLNGRIGTVTMICALTTAPTKGLHALSPADRQHSHVQALPPRVSPPTPTPTRPSSASPCCGHHCPAFPLHAWSSAVLWCVRPCRPVPCHAGPVPRRAIATPGQCHAGPVPVPCRASAIATPGQCHCHAGPVPVPRRASAIATQSGKRRSSKRWTDGLGRPTLPRRCRRPTTMVYPAHICTKTALTLPTSAPRLRRSPCPHPPQDWARRCRLGWTLTRARAAGRGRVPRRFADARGVCLFVCSDALPRQLAAARLLGRRLRRSAQTTEAHATRNAHRTTRRACRSPLAGAAAQAEGWACHAGRGKARGAPVGNGGRALASGRWCRLSLPRRASRLSWRLSFIRSFSQHRPPWPTSSLQSPRPRGPRPSPPAAPIAQACTHAPTHARTHAPTHARTLPTHARTLPTHATAIGAEGSAGAAARARECGVRCATQVYTAVAVDSHERSLGLSLVRTEARIRLHDSLTTLRVTPPPTHALAHTHTKPTHHHPPTHTHPPTLLFSPHALVANSPRHICAGTSLARTSACARVLAESAEDTPAPRRRVLRRARAAGRSRALG